MRELNFCPTGERQLAAYLENRLSHAERAGFAEHASTCPVCQSELEIWDKLSSLPTASPSAYFRQDFESMLVREARKSNRFKDASKWYARPALAWAAAAIFAIGGFFAGSAITTTRQPQPEVRELREELRNMRGMVAMSLLQQQSAVERLRGVNYSVRLDNPDEHVVEALVQTLRTDSSVGVRLAAADALRKYSQRPQVRQWMAEALTLQDSPLVQLALIDTMVEIRERRAAGAFAKLAASDTVDPTVKTRLEKAMKELKVQ